MKGGGNDEEGGFKREKWDFRAEEEAGEDITLRVLEKAICKPAIS